MKHEIKIPGPGESITEVEMASWLVEDGAYVEKNQEIGEIESEKATLPIIAEKSGRIKILIPEGATVKVGAIACIIDTGVKPDQKDEKPAKEPVAVRQKEEVKITPVARKIMENEGLSVDEIITGIKKITSREVMAVLDERAGKQTGSVKKGKVIREADRTKISQLRKKISERLVSVKNETAMLTTFNEVDMSAVISLRKHYQEQFIKKHDIKLGYMSFFTKAVTESLKRFPSVNSYIEGEEIVTPKYYDIGIAVQTDKGLMVPVIRNTEAMTLVEIEKKIAELADKARRARLGIDEMSGGTFTISNGGLFGSMLSTPILNPPQSGILGMHNIVDRPVVVNGEIVIRPMMYVALTYDHRVIDGRDSVSFLRMVKECIEDPGKMLFGGSSPDRILLDL